jgi:hypothetical protein
VPKRAQFTHERVEYNVFLFDEPLKGSKSLKMFKISLTFRFDKLSHLSKSVYTGENFQILKVSKILLSTLTGAKIVVYLMTSCVNWPIRAKKMPNLHTNELNTTFFCSTTPFKAPNRLKCLKLAWSFVLTSCDI